MGDQPLSQFQCWNCMPTIVILEGFGSFRKHMRMEHSLKKLSDVECNRYRCDGGQHYNQQSQRIRELAAENQRLMEKGASTSQAAINMSPSELGSLMQTMQQTIQTGIQYGMSNVLNLSRAVTYGEEENVQRRVQPIPNTNNFMVSFGATKAIESTKIPTSCSAMVDAREPLLVGGQSQTSKQPCGDSPAGECYVNLTSLFQEQNPTIMLVSDADDDDDDKSGKNTEEKGASFIEESFKKLDDESGKTTEEKKVGLTEKRSSKPGDDVNKLCVEPSAATRFESQEEPKSGAVTIEEKEPLVLPGPSGMQKPVETVEQLATQQPTEAASEATAQSVAPITSEITHGNSGDEVDVADIEKCMLNLDADIAVAEAADKLEEEQRKKKEEKEALDPIVITDSDDQSGKPKSGKNSDNRADRDKKGKKTQTRTFRRCPSSQKGKKLLAL